MDVVRHGMLKIKRPNSHVVIAINRERNPIY